MALEAAAKLYRTADDDGLVKRVASFFRHKETIVVLGSTGSGKTNLLNSLAAAAALVEPIPAITRTVAAERQRVTINERPFTIIDTPGQLGHDAPRRTVYREAIAQSPVRLINVVSYGYHEYATGSDEAVTQDGSPRDAWLERHRMNELAAMYEWLSIFGDPSTTKWILTAVTKADLWWNKRDAVINYYQNGEYAGELTRLGPTIHHCVLPYSSVFHCFYDRSPLAGTFDDSDRLQTNHHFLKQLVALG